MYGWAKAGFLAGCVVTDGWEIKGAVGFVMCNKGISTEDWVVGLC